MRTRKFAFEVTVSEIGQGPLIADCNQRSRIFSDFFGLGYFPLETFDKIYKTRKTKSINYGKETRYTITRLFHIPYHTLRSSVSELGAGAVFWPFWPCRPFWLLSIGKQRSLEGI